MRVGTLGAALLFLLLVTSAIVGRPATAFEWTHHCQVYSCQQEATVATDVPSAPPTPPACVHAVSCGAPAHGFGAAAGAGLVISGLGTLYFVLAVCSWRPRSASRLQLRLLSAGLFRPPRSA